MSVLLGNAASSGRQESVLRLVPHRTAKAVRTPPKDIQSGARCCGSRHDCRIDTLSGGDIPGRATGWLGVCGAGYQPASGPRRPYFRLRTLNKRVWISPVPPIVTTQPNSIIRPVFARAGARIPRSDYQRRRHTTWPTKPEPRLPDDPWARRHVQGRTLLREGHALTWQAGREDQHPRPPAHRQGGQDAGRRRCRGDHGRRGRPRQPEPGTASSSSSRPVTRGICAPAAWSWTKGRSWWVT